MRGESGDQKKADKQTFRLYVCHLCGRAGGTLVKEGESKYRHQGGGR
jgi:hypothetical protein